MKVAIVTQQLLNNYGGILQNYALQNVLKKIGHNPITIDYIYKPSFFRIVISAVKTIFLRIKGIRRRFLRRRHRLSNMNAFISNNITLSRKVHNYSSDLIREIDAKAIIVGSDQVWRPKYNPGVLQDMFLKFAVDLDIKRLAFSASFGVDNMDEWSKSEISICAQLLQKFDLVSVRELSGVELCKQYFSINAIQLLDPTMLLSQADYDLICKNIPVDSSDYIFAYILDVTEYKAKKIKEISKEYSCAVKQYSIYPKPKLSVESWLAMFRDAKYIVTDSFHGVVFSLIFQKKFIVIPNDSRGNTRIQSLLSIFNLSERMSSDINDYIDWQNVNKNMNVRREIALEYLKNALS